MYIILGLLLVFSFVLAVRSMKDLGVPDEINRMIGNKKYKGRIVFFRGKKTKHYSSSSSSSSKSSG